MSKYNILKKISYLYCNHDDVPFLIFSQKELKRMLDYSEMSQDNIVLIYEHNPIGTVYGITNQNTWNDRENKRHITLLDITDDSNW